MTFNFWHKLSEELYQRNRTELNDVFKPYIQRLIIALCRHCQMDPDHVSHYQHKPYLFCFLTHEVMSRSDMMPCIKIDKPLWFTYLVMLCP